MDFHQLRIGIGHDTHTLRPGEGPIRLGGIDIPHDHHLVGHSDADVLLHAVTDALLGAAARDDIGQQFPDGDEANRDRDSSEMLSEIVQQVRRAGFEIINVDCIVFAQRPKLTPHKAAIQQHIASLLGVGTDRVGVKAKTGEGVDAVGQERAIQAQCVALLFKT